MSVQFGTWNFAGGRADRDYLENVSAVVSALGPDGGGWYENDGVHILYLSFSTVPEASSGVGPHRLPSGEVLTWDGRLDNRQDWIRTLHGDFRSDSSDTEIVAAAYARYGSDCLPKLLGDWALAVWSPDTRALVLARDFLGIRHLYYHLEEDRITWSTVIDALLLRRATFSLSEEYVAGWFSHYPATGLTPYAGIHSVPPSHSLTLQHRKLTVKRYWDFDPAKKIRYRTDADYEEHFRAVFMESVKRRLRSNATVLAELSGGIDSSSIVCVADKLIHEGVVNVPRLDTISYFDDSENSWDERPYFTHIEGLRGRKGIHVDVGQHTAFPMTAGDSFQATPGHLAHHTKMWRSLNSHMASAGARVLLSGLGGDEALAGVPTPIPELADLLVRFQFFTLGSQLLAWAKARRQPLYQLAGQTVLAFLRSRSKSVLDRQCPVDWLEPAFVRRHARTLDGRKDRLRCFGPCPSFQACLLALEELRRQISAYNFSHPLCEKRFPYLDRDLWEFVCAVPRAQLIRPHERRSLMRRALAGIVPGEVLHQRRKAFVSRGPLATLALQRSSLGEVTGEMLSANLGIVNARGFIAAIEQARSGKEVSAVLLLRTLLVELWLRNLRDYAPFRTLSPAKISLNVPTDTATVSLKRSVPT